MFGNNAQGKTNILEALYFLSTTQSPRTQKSSELISWGRDEAILEAGIKMRYGLKTVIMQIKKNGEKLISVDHRFLKRTSDLLGQFPMIFFSPDDLEVIKKAPQGRRRFMDMLFSQANRTYAQTLMLYEKILKQRNECLRQINERRTTSRALSAWNDQLLETGFKITALREEGLKILGVEAAQTHQELTERNELLSVCYLSSFGKTRQEARQKLQENEAHEIASQRTLFGPHRDDIYILVNERDAKAFASHGQQRTAMISLKMAEIRYLEQAFGERPIVLLDDILLELDPSRFQALLRTLFQQTQTIMTGTETHRFLSENKREVLFYAVEQGSVQRVGPPTA